VRNFIAKYAEEILGLTVISADRKGGDRLFDVDVLAVNAVNTPFIIECKLDLVGAKALRQLEQYKKALRRPTPAGPSFESASGQSGVCKC
jgi:hypothetical protein